MFLGIHLDTVAMEASITAERKESLLQELYQLCFKRKCTKRQLLSLIGKLSFSYKVLPAGRIFLRHLINLSTTVTKLHHHLLLTTKAKLDLQWWLSILTSLVRKNFNPGFSLARLCHNAVIHRCFRNRRMGSILVRQMDL